MAAIQDELRARVEGVPAGSLLDGNRRIPLLVRGAEDLRHDAAAFAAAALARDDGGAVPLSQVLAFERTAGPVKVDRENASRFAVVIVGTAVQRSHPVLHLVAGGQHQHPRRIAAGAHCPQHLKPVDLRQHQVEHHHRVIVALQVGERLGAIGGLVQRVAGAGQQRRQRVAQALGIFYQQQAHRRPPKRNPGPACCIKLRACLNRGPADALGVTRRPALVDQLPQRSWPVARIASTSACGSTCAAYGSPVVSSICPANARRWLREPHNKLL